MKKEKEVDPKKTRERFVDTNLKYITVTPKKQKADSDVSVLPEQGEEMCECKQGESTP